MMMLRRWLHILTATACLSTLIACQSDDEQAAVQNFGDCYVNLAITVDNGHGSHRADPAPQGGEDGDGREAGFERENTIKGITLILYKDDNGINTAANPTLALVRYYPVTERTAGTMPVEITYTTGNQPLGWNTLDMTATYHAIVIANAPELGTQLTEGVSTLNDVRAMTTRLACVGNATASAALCTNFVMSSEKDHTINFGVVTPTKLDGTTWTARSDALFDLTPYPIVIERLAARIDFWAGHSTGFDATTYSKPGYVYPVTGSATDRFVITGIMPFNLVNGHASFGNEFVLKRVSANAAALEGGTFRYLADETTDSYVVDPQTSGKNTTASLVNPLSAVYAEITAGTITANAYYQSVADMHAATATTISGSEDVVVAYPMENTLLTTSKPYYYATGVLIVGYYYTNGAGAGTPYYYLGYLRHQGDAESYDILPSSTELSNSETMGTSPAMKYGVVRNNIYRISINSIDKKGILDLKIEVKKWDKFTHQTIYM